METKHWLVLKFGSSILTDSEKVHVVAQEINRYVSAGKKVIAVVSAFAGETDRLFRTIYSVNPEAPDHDVASFVSSGELQSAILLQAALKLAGTSCAAVSPADIRLRAEGKALDSDPVDVSFTALASTLGVHNVVVVPGFIALDAHQRTVLLGRGGSDDTALFLANKVQAECKLIKDVNGIFEWDPALPGPAPGRFASISWSDALNVANELIQDKAILFAQQNAMSFEVTRLGCSTGSIVGPGPTQLASEQEVPAILRADLHQHAAAIHPDRDN